VNVVGHDDKSVDSETALIAIAEEGGDHKLCAFRALE
jgi:hypothetical protein